MDSLKQRLEHIEQTIEDACERANRTRSELTLVAVTKSVSAERAQQVADLGILDLGENRSEGLLSKKQSISDPLNWHFIGNVQSRKVRDIINEISCLHSVDRLSLVKEIQKRAQQPVDCFIQVNVSGEDSKSGLKPDEVEPFFETLAQYDKVHAIGLMTMAPFTDDQEHIREVFRSLRELRDRIAAKQLPYAPCTELSMGMSNDYEIAIEEGATHIRIGTALVGSESEDNG